ncbi:ABC transporter substrate-binding protein [Paenibacillus sp. R14(2021)]|uniref:ABC transporter substrate-binding protein n=1 Tax=Paenibacillus sp. R14(2021) TaxID=2859228 RepID=UPI001C616668|nr:ABC transporter substrate-binding protein [Paenibacillus sp. R14(2021)]
MKKFGFAIFMLFLVLTLVVTACGKSNDEGNDNKVNNGAASGNTSGSEKIKITMVNSKSEIQPQLVAAADAFTKANPTISIEVLVTGGSQSPFEKVSTLYAAGTPATLNMMDAGDIVKFKDRAVDLSNEKWVADLAQPNQIDGKTLAFPFAIEGYGFIYNKAVLDKAVGGIFDPKTVSSTKALEELFQKIQSSGAAPLIIGSMDWSLGNHFLPIAYATQSGTDVVTFLDGLKAGTVKLKDNAQFNGLMDTFDVMKKYNMGSKSPMTVTYEASAAAVAKGEAGITFNGNWMMPEIQKSNQTTEFGFIPVPVSNDANDKNNHSIAIGATKQIFIDKDKSTEQQQAAAKKFLEWLVYDPAGQDFLVNKAGVIPAFKNITLEPKDSLPKAIKAYNNAGNAIPFGGNYVPGDHWKVLGTSMQKYLVGKEDKAALANDVENYWKHLK